MLGLSFDNLPVLPLSDFFMFKAGHCVPALHSCLRPAGFLREVTSSPRPQSPGQSGRGSTEGASLLAVICEDQRVFSPRELHRAGERKLGHGGETRKCSPEC